MMLLLYKESILLFITAIKFMSSSEHLESWNACLKNNILEQVSTFITLQFSLDFSVILFSS